MWLETNEKQGAKFILWLCLLQWNHSTTDVGRDIWRSSGPTRPTQAGTTTQEQVA